MYRNTNSYCFYVLTALLAVIATTHGFANPQSHTAQSRRSSYTSSSTSLQEAIVARNGLSYEDIEIGTGRNIFPGDAILCYYVGSYEQQPDARGDNPFFGAFASAKGAKTVTFDETEPGEPAEVVVGRRQVILGWDIGICGDPALGIPPMKIGGDRKLIIPAELAYGERGAGDAIPPNTDLYFQIDIVNAEKRDPGVSGDVKGKAFAGLVGFLTFMLLSLFVVAQNADKLMAAFSEQIN